MDANAAEASTEGLGPLLEVRPASVPNAVAVSLPRGLCRGAGGCGSCTGEGCEGFPVGGERVLSGFERPAIFPLKPEERGLKVCKLLSHGNDLPNVGIESLCRRGGLPIHHRLALPREEFLQEEKVEGLEELLVRQTPTYGTKSPKGAGGPQSVRGVV